MQPNLYPPGPQSAPSNLTSVNSLFRKQAWIAGSVLLLFMVFYLGLTGWFFYKSITLLINIFKGGADVFVSIILFLLMGFLGVFMFKGLFFKITRDESRSIEITEENEPHLFAFIHQVAADVNAPKPHRIFISEQVNACVFYDISIINFFFPRRKNLEIGLGLANVLNMAEFKAVLAHEFGHFAQRSMIIGRWVYVAQQVVYQIVSKRDAFDSFLRGISSIDIRIAWIGWGLSLIVWCLRSLSETFFKLVLYTQRALSRQMEFNADLVAVSVTGSDSLIHGLYKLSIADEAYEESLNFADKQLKKGFSIPDIFSVQTQTIRNKAHILGNPGYGLSPDLVGKDGSNTVVFDEKLAQIPKMWRTHPSSADREKNAKRTYIRSIPDERPVWLLFSDPDSIRKNITKILYTGIEAKTQPLLNEEVEKILDGESRRKYFLSKYRGIYLNRFITIAYKNIDEIIDPAFDASFSQNDFAKLYPESLQYELEHLKNLEEQLFMLEGVDKKVLETESNKLSFNGIEIRKKDLPIAIEEIKKQIAQVRKRIEEHDAFCRNIHYNGAKRIGKDWDAYLLSVLRLIHFCEHTSMHIEDLNRIFYENLNVAVRTKSFVSEYLNPIIEAGNKLQYKLYGLYSHAPTIVINERITSYLGTKNLGELLGRFEIGKVDRENINAWIQAIPHWVQAGLSALAELRNGALEELLTVEEHIEQKLLNKAEAGVAPDPVFIPVEYAKYDRENLEIVDRKPDLLSRIYHADGIAPTIARLIVASLIITAGILFSINIGGARIYIYNGLPRDIIVHVDDREIFVDGESTAKIKVDHKDHVHIKTTTENGAVIEEFDGGMSGSGGHIYNVAGAGIIYKWFAIYGGSYGSTEPQIIGATRWFLTDGDYIFEEPPATMSLKAGESSRKEVVAFHSAAPYELVNLLTDPQQISQMITAHATWEKSNSRNILLWLDMAYSLPNFKDILDHRVKSDPKDVLAMRIQQDVYTGKEREDLCDQQEKLSVNDPDNPDLYYLMWRCREDSPEQDSAFVIGLRKWPDNGWLANAVAYSLTCAENWKEALRLYKIAIASNPELGPISGVEVRRIRQYLDETTPLTEENENVPQLAYLNAIEKSTENSTDDKLYAFQLLKEGKFNEAVLYCVSDSGIYPAIVRLAAVSDGASNETQRTALNFAPEYGIDNTTLIPAIALRMRNGLSIDVYKEQINALAMYNAELFYEFMDAVKANRINEADKLLFHFNTELKAKSCLLGVLLLGNKAPLKWQIYSSRLLFIHEKPYFRKQVWME
jgi:Zn-dependent protease with chaperone function